MATTQHTVTGTTPPQDAPPSIGAHYTNTVTGQRWLAESLEDWGKPLPGPARFVDDTVLNLPLDVDAPVTVWKADQAGQRNILIPRVRTPGYYEMILVIEKNTSVKKLEIPIIVPEGVIAVSRQESVFISGPAGTYVRFGCWLSSSPSSIAVWEVLEQKVLGVDYKPIYYQFYGDTDTGIASDVTLGETPKRTVWNMTKAASRRLVLPKLSETFSSDFYTELDLVVWNQTPDAVSIFIDTGEGLPLIDHATLDAPASSATVFKLVYFVGVAQFRWTLAGTQSI